MIKVAIMGYGTVGSGVYEVFRTNKTSIDKKVGQELRVQYVLKRISGRSGHGCTDT